MLVLPQLAETISFAIRKAHETGGRGRTFGPHDPDVPRGRVVTVFSPKGGTGKTVLSTNLSALPRGARPDKRVLLIDLDLQFGDAAIMLGLDPERTMYELVQAPGTLDAGKLAGYTTHHRSGLDVLAAPMRPEDAELVTEAKVLQLLDVAREAYDIVVVDTSPFFYGPMLAVLRQTDQLLMLCGLDVPTLKNVKLSLHTLEMLGFPASRTSLVLNRVTPKVGLNEGGRRRGARAPGQLRDPERPRRGAVGQQRRRGSARPGRLRVRPGRHSHRELDRAGRCSGRPGTSRGSPEAALARVTPRPRREGIMNLEDQLRGDQSGAGSARLTERIQVDEVEAVSLLEDGRRASGVSDPYGQLKTDVQRAVIPKLGPWLFSNQESPDLRREVTESVAAELDASGTPLASVDRERLIEEIAADILGYGPLERFLADDTVTEVMVNGFDRVFVERNGKIEATDASFVDDDHLQRIIDKIVSRVGRRVDESSPMVDARLPDGSRVNAIIPPLSLGGPTLTIRKFARRSRTRSRT